MKKITKLIAILLACSLILTAMPLCFAANENDVEDTVSEDYNNFININGNDNNSLKAGIDYADSEILFNIVAGKSNASSVLKSISNEFGLNILETIKQTALKTNVKTSSTGYDSQTLYRASFDSSHTSVFEMCKAMNRLENVKDCEPNYYYTSCETSTFTMPTEISTSSNYATNQKWYFDNMNTTETWEKYNTFGDGELVCVIDNGLNAEHNEIKNQLWDDGNGNHGYNAEFNNNDIFGKLDGGPCHGSHCAGIIAMQANNGGLVGVAPNAKIMMCNAVTASTGYFTNANLIKSLEYATEHGADIISMSLGGYTFSVNFQRAITCASQSALIVCAAGNDGLNTTQRLHFPSASAAVIGVMALGSDLNTNTLSSYSNYDLTGRYYEIAAPGTSIYAIDANSNTGYVSMTGTSMATPFMAGICALYASKHQNMSATELRHSIKEASGELVKGYKSDAQTYSFKKATPLTMLSYSCDAPTNVTINDEALDNAVRTALNVSSSYQLTNYDLESVTSLDLSSSSFRNYSALKQLPNLCYLNLSNTGLTDAGAKEIFENTSDYLYYINFSGNKLTSTDFLKNYNGFLAKVNLANNQINDISALAKFTSISDLDISNNKIVDISALKTMTGVVYFYAPGNLIEDPTPIINLPYLEEIYFGNYNPNLADMFGESYFQSRDNGNRISTLEPFTKISKSSRIHYINLSYNLTNKDSEYNFHFNQVESILSSIGASKYSKNDITYKFVTEPNSKEQLTEATDFSVNDITIQRSKNAFNLEADFSPSDANHSAYVLWSSDSAILQNSKGQIAFNSLDIDSTKTYKLTATPSATSEMSAKAMYLTVVAPEAYSAKSDGENIIVKTNTATEVLKIGSQVFADNYTDADEVRTWILPETSETIIYPGDSCGYSENAAITLGTDKNEGRAKIIKASKINDEHITIGDEVSINVTSSFATQNIVLRDSANNEIPCKAVNISSNATQKQWLVSFTWTDDSSAIGTLNVLAKKDNAISTASVYTAVLQFNITINATDIAFNNELNSTTLYLNSGTYKIQYSVLPASANANKTVTFASKNTNIATVTSGGYIYPKNEGSTTITLTLPNGTVRSFFIRVEKTFCESAEIFNQSSAYTATKQYNAIIYTMKTSSIKLCDQNGNILGTFSNTSTYSKTLTDSNGTQYQRWIVPFTVNDAGDYTISAYAYNSGTSSYNEDKSGSFQIKVDSLTGNDAYGTITSYNNKFDTKISIYNTATSELIQTVIIKGISSETTLATTTNYKFTNIPNGTYNIKIEKEGCSAYSIIEVKVNGNTEIKESNAGGTHYYSLDSHAGDINSDGIINVADASVVLLNANYAKTISDSQDVLCDINGDGLVSIDDLSIILVNCI